MESGVVDGTRDSGTTTSTVSPFGTGGVSFRRSVQEEPKRRIPPAMRTNNFFMTCAYLTSRSSTLKRRSDFAGRPGRS